jgi:type IV pilus assembly protein PilV
MLIELRKQRGVGLIEVLVTLLVLSVGLLGLAALQNTALRFSHTAMLESQAQFLIRDLIDSMRVAGAVNAKEFEVNFTDSATAAPINCKTSNCSSAKALALWSLEQWRSNVSALLPRGEVEIRRTNATSNEYMVTIRYDDLRGETPADPGQPVTRREVSVVTRI